MRLPLNPLRDISVPRPFTGQSETLPAQLRLWLCGHPSTACHRAQREREDGDTSKLIHWTWASAASLTCTLRGCQHGMVPGRSEKTWHWRCCGGSREHSGQVLGQKLPVQLAVRR